MQGLNPAVRAICTMQRHRDTDLNFDFEIFWLEERRICQSLQKQVETEGLTGAVISEKGSVIHSIMTT